MKYSQSIGLIAALAVLGICFMPWSYIAEKDILITGFHAEGTSFGKPGLMNIILSTGCLILFAIPRIWAKRTNLFITAINFAWAIRNYLLLTTCQAGECPQKKAGIYLLLLATFIILVMAMLPKIKLPEND